MTFRHIYICVFPIGQNRSEPVLRSAGSLYLPSGGTCFPTEKKLGSRVYLLLHQPSYFRKVSTNTNETVEPILNTFTIHYTYKPKEREIQTQYLKAIKYSDNAL